LQIKILKMTGWRISRMHGAMFQSVNWLENFLAGVIDLSFRKFIGGVAGVRTLAGGHRATLG
jgi:hypothetical protein